MKKHQRFFLFILIFGGALVVGGALEGFSPLPVTHEQVMVSSYSEEEVLSRSLLYARNFRIVLQVLSDDNVNVVLTQIDGLFSQEWNSTSGFTAYGTILTKGFFNLSLYNPNSLPVIVTISFDLFGVDKEIFLIGQILFGVGFVLTLVNLFYDIFRLHSEENEIEEYALSEANGH